MVEHRFCKPTTKVRFFLVALMSDIKQVIVIRKDLKMRRGKECAQVAHASEKFLIRQLQNHNSGNQQPKGRHIVKLSKPASAWIQSGSTKVCLQVNSEEELLEIHNKAKEAGLVCHLVTDSGKTEFEGVPTKTCLAIGPDEVGKIDKITGELKLY